MDKDTLSELLAAVRRFVDERLIPLEAKVAEDDAIPADALAEMRALGLFGLSIPEDYGGLGLSMEDECRTMFEFCRCSPAPIRSPASAPCSAGLDPQSRVAPRCASATSR